MNRILAIFTSILLSTQLTWGASTNQTYRYYPNKSRGTSLDQFSKQKGQLNRGVGNNALKTHSQQLNTSEGDQLVESILGEGVDLNNLSFVKNMGGGKFRLHLHNTLFNGKGSNEKTNNRMRTGLLALAQKLEDNKVISKKDANKLRQFALSGKMVEVKGEKGSNKNVAFAGVRMTLTLDLQVEQDGNGKMTDVVGVNKPADNNSGINVTNAIGNTGRSFSETEVLAKFSMQPEIVGFVQSDTPKGHKQRYTLNDNAQQAIPSVREGGKAKADAVVKSNIPVPKMVNPKKTQYKSKTKATETAPANQNIRSSVSVDRNNVPVQNIPVPGLKDGAKVTVVYDNPKKAGETKPTQTKIEATVVKLPGASGPSIQVPISRLPKKNDTPMKLVVNEKQIGTLSPSAAVSPTNFFRMKEKGGSNITNLQLVKYTPVKEDSSKIAAVFKVSGVRITPIEAARGVNIVGIRIKTPGSDLKTIAIVKSDEKGNQTLRVEIPKKISGQVLKTAEIEITNDRSGDRFDYSGGLKGKPIALIPSYQFTPRNLAER